MASTPAFAATARCGIGSITASTASKDGTAAVTVLTAGSAGTKIEEITLKADGDLADGVLVLYIHDGSAYHVFDEWDYGNPAAGSATVTAYRETRYYNNLFLPSGYSLRASNTVAPTAGGMRVFAFGGDF